MKGMLKTTVLLLAIGAALAATAMPDLQPCVKEYAALGKEVFSIKQLPVFHQDQRQCEIAADETTACGAKQVWDGKDDSRPGVYIAVAGSGLAKRLVKDFTMDVPAKKQGYAIKAKGGRVAIVGYDPIGALYGAVTLRQMAADGGMVEAASVRDWPDVLYRGAVSIGRGLYMLGNGENSRESRAAAIKAGFDMMLRQKFNMFTDHFIWVTPESPEETKAFWREVTHYGAERGIYANVYGTTAVYQRDNVPKGTTFDSWPCVKLHCTWDDSYYCWADDALTEQAAERFAQYLIDIGAEKSVLNIHPADGGGWKDPEMWSRRCAKCRARWNDNERWKASVNQFDIWCRVLRKRLPEAIVGSCIYPYTFNALLAPEKDRTAKWKESMPEYWKHLDESLSDKDFFFSSWNTTTNVLCEVRALIPRRTLHFSDFYPETAGLFSTYHRKIATCCEPGTDTYMTTQGTDNYLYLESLFLANEAMWDKNMPNAEPFDGYTYYDAMNDHIGPAGIMTNNLRRICRTFWGRELAPYMERVLSSGVMPEYLRDPAAKVRYWNRFRKDPMYDPMNPDQEAMLKNVKYKPIIDDIALMRTQVVAAQVCVAALMEAESLAAGLDHYKRKYFMKYFKYAPFWLATARALLCVREANALVADGRNAEALKLLAEGRKTTQADYAFATKNFKDHVKDLDPITQTNHHLDIPREWKFDEAAALKLIDQAAESAKVVLKPRRIGRTIRVGVMKGGSTPCIMQYLERFENVTAEVFEVFSLASLDRFDCVFLPDVSYDKSVYFDAVKAYVERGGGGVFLEGPLCGHKRFDVKTPFPEIVKTSPEQVQNFTRRMKFPDGTDGETMYVDFFAISPGPEGEVRAYGPDGKKVMAVRGKVGLGKVFFSGTFNIGSLTGDSYDTKVCPLFGANAVFAREAIEYFTGVKLKERNSK